VKEAVSVTTSACHARLPPRRAVPLIGSPGKRDAHCVTIDVPDGLHCGTVYYSPVFPTRDVYSWDAVKRSGVLESSFATGCDEAPGGVHTYPFTLARL
jgi:hypothetical protein